MFLMVLTISLLTPSDDVIKITVGSHSYQPEFYYGGGDMGTGRSETFPENT
jgi:hypothetical protein